MKAVFLLIICCLGFHNGNGAPRKAVYKFVRCNPDGNQANCVTQQSSVKPWSPDLPAKLPASTAQYLKTEPVEDEYAPRAGEEETTMRREAVEDEYTPWAREEETTMRSEDGASSDSFQGSGGYDGSGVEDSYMADRARPGVKDAGSGEPFMEMLSYKDKKGRSRKLIPGEFNPTEQDLKEDHLLNF